MTPAANSSPLYIGQYGGNADRLDGVIDEVRLYNVALSQAQIQSDMNSPLGTAPPPPDSTPPVRSNGQPTGTLAAGTTQASLSLTTSENATCRYGPTAGVAYAALPTSFTTTGGTTHSTTVTGLVNGASYTYFVRCQDAASNANPNDFQIAFAVAQPAPPSSGLVAAYGFNEGSGGTAADATGKGHTASLVGATWTAAGKNGNALAFNGSSNLVSIADAPDLDVSTALTMEAWVRPTAASGWRTVALKEAPGGLAYALYARDSAATPGAYVDTGGGYIGAPGSTALPLNTWTHLAMTYDGSNARLYVNGGQVGVAAVPGALRSSTNALTIGGNTVWGEWFAGQIDDLRIYNRVLSAGEITTDMSTPVGGAPAPDTTPPSVSITSPAAAALVSGNVTIAASASDNSGTVANVQFLVDGAPIGGPDSAAPFTATWPTGAVSNGSHLLTAVATDPAGNQATSAGVTVTVNNGWTAPSGLVAAYTFAEGTGGMTADVSGNGNAGALTGGTAWSTAGRFGTALSFDGVNDLVSIADAPSIDLTAGMTIEAWVNPAALGGWRTVALKGMPGGLVYALYAHDSGAPRPAAWVNTTGSSNYVAATGTSALPLGTWSHLAMTVGGGTLRIYVNGVQVGSQPVSGTIRSSTHALEIGGNTVWSEWFAGLIDEVRIYNRALTQAEIQAGMSQTLGGG